MVALPQNSPKMDPRIWVKAQAQEKEKEAMSPIYQLTTNENRQLTVSSPSAGEAIDWALQNYPGETVVGVSVIPETGQTVETGSEDDEE